MAKAACYGLGLEVARRVAPYVMAFGVAYGEEGVTLRRWTDKPILVMSPVWTADDVARYKLTPCVQDVSDVARLAGLRAPCGVHIKLNTGMNRYGVPGIQALREVIAAIEANPLLTIEGACTHYAGDASFARQNRRLLPMLTVLPRGICIHTEASPTAYRGGFDAVRVGLGAYRDSVRIESRVLSVHHVAEGERVGYDGIYTVERTQYIAVIAGGYADGLAKALRGHLVSIRGALYPIVAVCMDVCMVAMDRACAVGDAVVVLGEGPDPVGLSLYEMYTGLHGRCAFAYRGEE